jgi:hypothetical protein
VALLGAPQSILSYFQNAYLPTALALPLNKGEFGMSPDSSAIALISPLPQSKKNDAHCRLEASVRCHGEQCPASGAKRTL